MDHEIKRNDSVSSISDTDSSVNNVSSLDLTQYDSLYATVSSVDNDSLMQIYNSELVRENQHIGELNKAIKSIRPSRKRRYSAARVEAQKLLQTCLLSKELISCAITNLENLYEDIRYLKNGSLIISNIKLDFSIVDSIDPFEFYVCFVIHEKDLLASNISQADSHKIVSFPQTFSLCNVSPDFQIILKMYGMEAKRKASLINVPACLPCVESRNLEDCQDGESEFKFIGEVSLRIENINRTYFNILRHPPLYTISGELSASVDFTFELKAWVDIRKGESLFWNRRWCLLMGPTLKYWNYSIEKNFSHPIEVIDLTFCQEVTFPGKLVTMRSNTLLVTIKTSTYLKKYYISFDIASEYEYWKAYLNDLVPTVKIWKRNGYNFSI